ncbi:growth/differentiation factor 9 isoform X1 [Oryzias melastigma]|uniref:Growth differentiation factor 9 n=2 Tax=Oryzias melastigma TaxID=30732 RepID=A0A3B3D5Y7_ORYME|nr:growth/differentiation factor 9 isoform X1 [Oryzias melastigma]
MFTMDRSKPVASAVRCLRGALLLFLVSCNAPLPVSPSAASNALLQPDEFTYPYSSIFSPLLRALSEHGGSRWNPGQRRKVKPEHRYMRYLTEVYKKPSRRQRSVVGDKVYNTIRLIKPQDECLVQSHTESFTQDLSYSLDQVRDEEQLLRSALLFRLDHDLGAPAISVCSLSLTEPPNHCQLCPRSPRAANLSASANRKKHRKWVELDVSSIIQPVMKSLKKNIKLLLNVSRPDGQRSLSINHRNLLEFSLRSPPLILYLKDMNKSVHHRAAFNASSVQSPFTETNAFQKPVVFKSERKHKRRWKREPSKSKRGDKGLDLHLPDLLPSSVFPTSDCALYDFRVRFSQLKLDHWIVFPPKYNPRYCKGICPRTMGFIYGSPVHTMVQNIIYEKLDSSVPRPSCVPSHYSPLSVMIVEEDGSYVYKEFKDMIATRCTCR